MRQLQLFQPWPLNRHHSRTFRDQCGADILVRARPPGRALGPVINFCAGAGATMAACTKGGTGFSLCGLYANYFAASSIPCCALPPAPVLLHVTGERPQCGSSTSWNSWASGEPPLTAITS